MAIRVRDALGRDVIFYHPPRRIVSLVPSDTYSLFRLGAGERVVGRTTYCVEPVEGVAAIPTVGGTKDADVDAVLALAPDLVVANQEENARPALEKLAQRGVNVYVSLPKRVADGVAHLARLARMLGVASDPAAAELIRRGYAIVKDAEQAAAGEPVATFLPIWMDPLMTLGGDTFGSDMLTIAGARNVFADRIRYYPLAADLGKAEPLPEERVAGRDVRYPRITLAEVEARAPALVLLPSEPYPFSETEAEVFRELAIPAGADGVRFCDGADLFWYGARSVDAVPRLRALVASCRGSTGR